MKKKSIVLLSGGLDSSVNFFSALRETEVLLALTFDYGQRAVESEIKTAKELSSEFKIPHQVMDLRWMIPFTQSSLVSRSQNVPTGKNVEIDDLEISKKSAKAVWVPNRNGVFLNIAAAIAESLSADFVVVGFNKEEAQTFPDNSLEYVESLNHCFNFSTANKVKVKCYTVDMNKTEIVKWGSKFQVPFKKLWPCYFSGEKICGECESCKRYIRAIKESGVKIEI
jgi:7-cyano-7-deazaguanine synthase